MNVDGDILNRWTLWPPWGRPVDFPSCSCLWLLTLGLTSGQTPLTGFILLGIQLFSHRSKGRVPGCGRCHYMFPVESNWNHVLRDMLINTLSTVGSTCTHMVFTPLASEPFPWLSHVEMCFQDRSSRGEFPLGVHSTTSKKDRVWTLQAQTSPAAGLTDVLIDPGPRASGSIRSTRPGPHEGRERRGPLQAR